MSKNIIWNDDQYIRENRSKLWNISCLLYIISGLIFSFIFSSITSGISLIVLGACFYIIGRDTSSKNDNGEIAKNKKDDASNLTSIKVVFICSLVVLFTSIIGIGNYCYDWSYSRAYNKQMVKLELEKKKNEKEIQNMSEELNKLRIQI